MIPLFQKQPPGRPSTVSRTDASLNTLPTRVALDQVDQYSCRCSFCFSSFETNIYLAKKKNNTSKLPLGQCTKGQRPAPLQREEPRGRWGQTEQDSVVKNWNNKAEQEADFKSQSCLQVSDLPTLPLISEASAFSLLGCCLGLASHCSAERSHCSLMRLVETVGHQ